MNDIVNALFECGGGLFLGLNCWRLYQHKEVKGVSVAAEVFFTFWGCWNLYYYPSLNQFASLAAGVLTVCMNALWIAMAVHYTRRKKEIDHEGS